ncbi:hypothetical protein X945_5763 [Burkholderia pseudomallei ABCPW 107]|nr:hypothetical protein X945_5763 [Burkholderia pseudomallei ABCPW 107]
MHQIQQPEVVCKNPGRERENVALHPFVVVDDRPIKFHVSKFAIFLQSGLPL